jgi:BCL2/adenovirus E1B protein-interacting protein 3
VELTNNLIQSCSDRVTPPLPFSSGDEYLRLLKEAQKESNQSSRISSRRDTPKNFSPKSPPNSPNPEPATNEDELRGIFINYAAKVSCEHCTLISLIYIFASRARCVGATVSMNLS